MREKKKEGREGGGNREKKKEGTVREGERCLSQLLIT